ncbi:MAG: glycoside hydrolase family 2 protein [Cetobacterium sp.]
MKYKILNKLFIGLIVIIVLLFSSKNIKKGEGMDISFQNLGEQKVPILRGKILHSFDETKREIITLDGEWLKLRFQDINQKKKVALDYFREKEAEKKVLPFPENEILGIAMKGAVENYNYGVWYYKNFSLKDGSNKNGVLKFLGANYFCEVWMNGEYLGKHEGGFNAFSLNIENKLKNENEILIKIFNPEWGSSKNMIPGRSRTDYFNYTGVLQSLYLEILPESYIARTSAKTKDNKNLEIVSYFDNLKNNQNYEYETTVYESQYNQDFDNPNLLKDTSVSKLIGKQVHNLKHEVKTFSERGYSEVNIELKDIKEWSIRKPNLYIIKNQLFKNGKLIDESYLQFGFRTIKTDEDKIKFNNKVAFFAGVARHEDWVDSGRTASWEKIVEDIKLIYDLRATMVRTGHYPNHLDTYKILDRIGLVSMVELPIWQHEKENFDNEEAQKLALNMWRETTLNLENSPSVIMWSTQNESNAENERILFNKKLKEDILNNHPDYRLVTQSAAADRPGYFDKSMEFLDVAGWTMYFEIFYGKDAIKDTKDFLENAHKSWPNKPIINTEYGIWSSSGEQNQADITEKTLKAMLEYSSLTPEGKVKSEKGYLALVNYWSVFDWFCDHNEWIQTMGVYDLSRQNDKKVKEIIKKYYGLMTDENNGLEK